MTRIAWVVLLTSCLAWAGAPAVAKKKPSKKPPAPVTNAEVTRALDARQAEVGACVVASQPPNSKWTQVLKVKVVLNGAGQVFSLDLGLEPANDKSAEAKACIDQALRTVTWPKLSAPLVTAERVWTFSMQ